MTGQYFIPYTFDMYSKLTMITLPETNSSHLKMDGWKGKSFPFWMASPVGATLVPGSV